MTQSFVDCHKSYMESLMTAARALGAAALAALLLLPSPGGAAEPKTAELYRQHCAVCHGEHGDGRSRAQYGLSPPPRDFTTAEAAQELSRERMITSIAYGRPGTAMVAWGKRFGSDQIAALADYIRATFMVRPSGHEDPGSALYKRHCSACHGDRGSGATWTQNSLNPPPRDFTAPAARAELSRERMLTSVTYGRPGTAMMPFRSRLSDAQIATVVDYIRSHFMTGDAAAPAAPEAATLPPHHPQPPAAAAPAPTPAPRPAADMSLPMPQGLHGDAERGRQFYLGNCYVCHGRSGNGKGPRADFIVPPPRNFLSAEARRVLNRPALFQAIWAGRPGTMMPTWSRVLNDQQIADVAEFVFQAFIRPASPEAKKKALNR